MTKRVGFPPGVPSWIDSSQPDPEAAAAFYGHLFGWTFEDVTPAGASLRYLIASLSGDRVAAVSSAIPGAGADPGWNTYIAVEDLELALDRVRTAGGEVLTPSTDMHGHARAAVCRDPTGARFGLWEPAALKGAEAVNAPNTWNFSMLNVNDVDVALRFYGAVFGWETSEPDELGSIMVRLPGYADFLEQFYPGIRERHADFGAPVGFSDCVAWILPAQRDDALWSVTFNVADADEVADRAARLGGTVIRAPYDEPPSRLAILRDPARVEFTVSAFNSS